MPRKVFICLLALFFIQTAHADSVKDALDHKYKNHVLALRSPFTPGDQKFNSDGHRSNEQPGREWAVYGGLFVQKLDLSSDTLRIEGPRVAPSKNHAGNPTLVPLGRPVRVEIHLDQPINSLDDAEIVLNRVFFPEGDTADHAKPDYRRRDDHSSDEHVYQLNKEKTVAPRPTFTPEPDYTKEAKDAKYQGTVLLNIIVDTTGRVSRIRLERALGLGLDENAVDRVKTWRFDPARLNGKPVAIALNIEVSFNLY